MEGVSISIILPHTNRAKTKTARPNKVRGVVLRLQKTIERKVRAFTLQTGIKVGIEADTARKIPEELRPLTYLSKSKQVKPNPFRDRYRMAEAKEVAEDQNQALAAKMAWVKGIWREMRKAEMEKREAEGLSPFFKPDLSFWVNFRDRIKAEAQGMRATPVAYPDQLNSLFTSFMAEKRHSPKTAKLYQLAQKAFGEWQLKTGRVVTTSTLSNAMYPDFVGFLENRGNSVNTIGSYIRLLKAFFNWAADPDRGLLKEGQFHRWKAVSESRYKIAFSLDQVQTLRSLNLEDRPELIPVRDVILFACLSGQRYGDIQKMGKESRGLDGYLRLRTSKGVGSDVTIPITTPMREIFDRNGGWLPPRETNASFNRKLKVLAEVAGFTRVLDSGKRFCDECASHMGRRTFARLMVLQGMNEQEVMKVTGHKSVKVFRSYVQVEGQQAATKIGKGLEDLFGSGMSVVADQDQGEKVG